MIIPLGLADSSRSTIPLASAAIGLACIAVFVADQWQLSAYSDERVTAFHEYWQAHPYLVPPKELVTPAEYNRAVAERDRRKDAHTLPDEATRQQELDELTHLFLRGYGNPWHLSGGLVPSEGILQLGWLTAPFLHVGLLHLLGNLFFLAVVGPVLEEVLTLPTFLVLFFVGGLMAGLAQVLASLDSSGPIIGASGAIAACMGAVTVRCPTSMMRVFVLRSVVEWPVFVWTLAWVAGQAFTLMIGGASGGGVAVMAHIGGFAFGAAAALGLRAAGVGDRPG